MCRPSEHVWQIVLIPTSAFIFQTYSSKSQGGSATNRSTCNKWLYQTSQAKHVSQPMNLDWTFPQLLASGLM